MGTPFNERDSTCRVNLIDDSLFEEDEFFFVKLEKASYNARLGKIDTVKVIIDGPNDFPIIQMSETIMHVEENSGKYSDLKLLYQMAHMVFEVDMVFNVKYPLKIWF